MDIIQPSVKLVDFPDPLVTLRRIEYAYRLCYKSEGKMPETGYDADFIRSKIAMGHLSPLEHSLMTFHFVCDRGVSHEMVRHRIASPSQESTRYCNYGKRGISAIQPNFWFKQSPIFSGNPNNEECVHVWCEHAAATEVAYNKLLLLGASPQEARSVLMNSTKTELVLSMNFRECRHFFDLRALGTTGKPHPQMLEVAIPALKLAAFAIPVIFDDQIAKLKDQNSY